MKILAIVVLLYFPFQYNSSLECCNKLLNQDEEEVTSQIRVLSYNIRYNNPDDGINAWPNRSDSVSDIIGVRVKPDIVGLQEVLKDQLDDLEERLPAYASVGQGRDDGKDAGEFSPIFYRPDKFELIENDMFWLSETPDVPGSKSWDAAITRIVTWALFLEKETNQKFYVYNTHFDHRGERARLMSARMVVSRISEIEKDIPVIVTGDMNVQESSEVYSVFTEESVLLDARYVSKNGHTGPTTTSNNWEELRQPESRIDYIFVRGVSDVLNHIILDDRYDGRFPSDHLPVMADIVLK